MMRVVNDLFNTESVRGIAVCALMMVKKTYGNGFDLESMLGYNFFILFVVPRNVLKKRTNSFSCLAPFKTFTHLKRRITVESTAMVGVY